MFSILVPHVGKVSLNRFLVVCPVQEHYTSLRNPVYQFYEAQHALVFKESALCLGSKQDGAGRQCEENAH